MATEAEILNPLVVALAVKRQEYEAKKTALRRQRDAWEEAHQDEINAVALAQADMDIADAELREEAVTLFALSGLKSFDGVEVKLFDTFKVDKETATTWAHTHMPALLSLDLRAYEKVLREVRASKLLSELIAMPGLVDEEPRATIARDLSAYLPATDTPSSEAVPVIEETSDERRHD